jgi:hypothetical protein
VIDHSEAPSHCDEVDAQFLALVCADEELLYAEFDETSAGGRCTGKTRLAPAPPTPPAAM